MAPNAIFHVVRSHTLSSMVRCLDQDFKCFNTIKSTNAKANTKMKAMGVTNAATSNEATDVGGFEGLSLGTDEGEGEADGSPEGTLDG